MIGSVVVMGCLPGRAVMIGTVESGTFENNSYRRVNFVKRLLSAFRTFGQRVIGKMLKDVKLMTAGFTTISIGRHSSVLYQKNAERI